MNEVDWVALATSVAGEGINALVPGSGIAIDLASRAMEPQLTTLQQWRENRAEQAALAHSITDWATHKGYKTAEIENGMNAAKDILRQKGASWGDMANWNLDASRIAREVLSQDPVPQQNLGQTARDVCTRTVTVFYIQLLKKSELAPLIRASLGELLRRAEGTGISIDQLRDQTAQLQASAQRATREERLGQQLREIRDVGIGGLEMAESNFRTVTRPNSEFYTPAEIREARTQLVSARVILESRAKELTDAELRDVLLAYVAEDEKQDRALKGGSADIDTYNAVRSTTVEAYNNAQNSVAEALQRLNANPA